jgi:serine/threonine protein kinase
MATSNPMSAPEKLAGWTLQHLPEAPPENLSGRLFARRYLLEKRLAGGGMSTIYAARDGTLGKQVVVKIMRADLPSDPVDRFRREAVVLAGLSHEHIGGIIDRQDPDDGPRFLVAEYIDGLDLSLLRRRGPVPAAVVVQIGLQVSAALAYAHGAGVIHRDVKPSNIMLVRHPGGDVFAKVIDFGIAKMTRGSDLADGAPLGARRETRGDYVAGTAPYWGGHEGPRRDVYALALSLAELLTGEDPNPAVDLAREHIPAGIARVMTAALRGEVTTMDIFHTMLREADVQAPGDAEAERRRYIARTFPVTKSSDAPPADHTPRFAGRYVLCGELGAGGMGRVHTAFDTVNRRHVALKTIHPRCAGMTNLEQRFRREGWALAAIVHPGAPILFESGAEPEPFFTMEIVEGTSLAAVLGQGKLDPVRALTLAIDLAGVLHAAHEVGVIHRDVKPDNIVLGQGDRVRLLDFGCCLLMPRFYQRHLLFPATPTGARYATGEHEGVGTPGYSAPEIVECRGTAGPRSDIYSVCVVLYEMLTGRQYENAKVGRARPIERGEFPAILGPIADVLRRGTAREPSERPWSMADLSRSLEIVRAAAIEARRRRQLAVVAILAVLSTVAVVGVALGLVARGSATPPAPAPVLAASAQDSPAAPVQHEDLVDNPAPEVPPQNEQAEPYGPEKPPAPVGKVSTMARPAASVPLTAAEVRTRLTRRREKLSKCGSPTLVLGLTITGGRHMLTAVNGMPAGDPVPVNDFETRF